MTKVAFFIKKYEYQKDFNDNYYKTQVKCLINKGFLSSSSIQEIFKLDY